MIKGFEEHCRNRKIPTVGKNYEEFIEPIPKICGTCIWFDEAGERCYWYGIPRKSEETCPVGKSKWYVDTWKIDGLEH